MKAVKNITFNEFVESLQENSEPKYIKFFAQEKYATDLSAGKICLGTVEYYRQAYDGDGRGDQKESIETTEGIAGEVIALRSGIRYLNTSPIQRGKPEIVQDILQGLLFCCCRFVITKEGILNLLETARQMGPYCCVLSQKDLLTIQKTEKEYHSCLDKCSFVPTILSSPSKAGKVEYVSHPDSSGFKKIDLEEYRRQQEYRIVFSFRNKDNYLEPVGKVSARYIFKIEPLQCPCFRLRFV